MTFDNRVVSNIVYTEKYLQVGETFEEGCDRVAGALSDDNTHFKNCKSILYNQLFLPGGRVFASVGSARQTTAFNCYVSRTIDDSMKGIYQEALWEAAQTMRLGGGIGYDFSTLRPCGDNITTLQSTSCGPVGNDFHGGFMDVFDASCSTIRSAGHRRGAQMGCMRIDHPDIEAFVRAKRNLSRLRNFNVSVLVTNEFMEAVRDNKPFELVFNGRVYKTISAVNLWNEIMRSAWDYAEPGVLFIDKINERNNLKEVETISATNPCGEQPLPPYGACLLGSFNLTRFYDPLEKEFNFGLLKSTIPIVVRMMDNVIDETVYPLPQQKIEATHKRRMGLGITGLADVLAALGYHYGGPDSIDFIDTVMRIIANECYLQSSRLAKEKGPAPVWNETDVNEAWFVKHKLEDYVKDEIAENGLRNSHLLSVAPTGTISLAAGNVSSGIEPIFSRGSFTRKMFRPDGALATFTMAPYCEAEWGVKEYPTSDDISVLDHLKVFDIASTWVDSAVSKTINLPEDISFEDFKEVYNWAHIWNPKGCTVYRKGGKLEGILSSSTVETEVQEGAACYVDPETGLRSCE